ncbi:MAG: 2-hydroxyacyl-CoA dehydratase [Deltaproteobacteria bacterium]|nr:2-hydroxyacyl-CoA dehydratase [Deltaproteobacteria bacterium]MBW2345107.1 2-hydroxyacyl-CoA dehydratase [Deltaproteobacteria bacterium]
MDTPKKKRNVYEELGESWLRAATAKEDGKKVAMIPFNFSPEILYAMDIVPVTVEVLSSELLLLEEGLTAYIDLAVEQGFPETMCSTQKGVIGLLEAGIVDKPDLIVNGAAGFCGPNAKGYEYMARKFDIPIIFIDDPYYHDQRSNDYYVRGFKRIVSALEEMTGKKVDEDRLREVCELSNEATELYLEIAEMKRQVPNPVPNMYNMGHTDMRLMFAGTQEAVNFYKMMHAICKERLKNGEHVKPEERIRLYVMYTGFYFDMTFLSWLEEEMGVTYLMDILQGYDFNPIIDTTSTDSMIRDLAITSLNMPMARQLKGAWNGTAGWLQDTLYYVKNYKADCMLFSGHVACKQAWGAYRLVADEVKKQLGVPSLRLEGDGWDHRITPMSVIKEQLSEFFDMVLENK